MNIIVNKKLNEDYLEKYLTSMMSPNSEAYTGFKTYSDLTTDTTVSSDDYPFILFAPESYLNIINKLNTLQYNGELTLPEGSDFTMVMNSLYSKNANVRNRTIDALVTAGVLSDTTDSTELVKTLVSDFTNFDISKLNMSYVDTTIPGNEDLTDVIQYEYESPVEMNNPYDQVDNTNSDTLYLVVLPLVNKNYGNTDGTHGDYVSTHSYQNGAETSKQSSYIAIKLGDITSEDADVKFDHVDKIDYIDSFKLRFRLPKVLN